MTYFYQEQQIEQLFLRLHMQNGDCVFLTGDIFTYHSLHLCIHQILVEAIQVSVTLMHCITNIKRIIQSIKQILKYQ